jgi:uncharacterized protein involved in exopolysaccharide biosynthesis
MITEMRQKLPLDTAAEKGTHREGEIDLMTLSGIVWSHKYRILLASGLCGLVAAILAITATPLYRAEVTVTQVKDSGMGSTASLANQFSGLASLAGINLANSGGPGQQAQAVLKSRRLAEAFITREHLVSQLFPRAKRPPTLWFAVNQFRDGVLSIHEDKLKGTTTVAIEWTDPLTAARWANGFMALANELLRARALNDSQRNIAYLNEQIARTNVVELQRVMYNLVESETKTLMLANARAEYAFSVVDPAVPPEVRFSPKRTLMVVLGVIVGLFIGTIGAFVHHRLREEGRKAAQGS